MAEEAPLDDALPLTRRRIRERERLEAARRAAEDGALVNSPSAATGSASDEALASDVVESEKPREAATEALELAPRAGELERNANPAAVGSSLPALTRTGRRLLTRTALLGTLAAVTIVVPLTGVALPTSSSDSVTGAPLAETSALEVFSTGGTTIAPDASAALAADPLASLRSTVSTSRSGQRGDSCGSSAIEANGVLAGEVEITPPEAVMPIAEGSYRYTSGYGMRVHPIFGSYGEHTGVDMAAAAGTPIHAVADGTVVHAGSGRDGRSSMLVIIEHEVDGQKVWTWYVHMYPDGVYVSEGERVSAGEVIGAVGAYGNATGPNMHFEVHVGQDQSTIDPEAWLAEKAAPLTSQTLQCIEG